MNFTRTGFSGALRLGLLVALSTAGCHLGGASEDAPVDSSTQAATAPRSFCFEWVNGSGGGGSTCGAAADPGAFYRASLPKIPAGQVFYALYPQALTQELCRDQSAIRDWYALAKTNLDFLRRENVNAEALEASHARIQREIGKMGELQVLDKDSVKNKAREVRDRAKDKLTGVFEGAKGFQAAVTNDAKEASRNLTPVVERTVTRLNEVADRGKPLLARYLAYKATEPGARAELEALATRASTSTLATYPQVDLDLKALETRDADARGDIALELKGLLTRMAVVLEAYERDIADHRAYLQNQGLGSKVYDGSERIAGAFRAAIAYIDARRDATGDAVKRIRDGIVRRRAALLEGQLAENTRANMRAAQVLEASTDFLNQATERMRRLATAPPTSTALKVPYILAKYDEHVLNLESESMCNEAVVSAASWMHAGCESLKRDFGRSRLYIQTTAPALIRIALPRLKANPVTADVAKEIEQYLAAGRVREAAASYDLALRALDAQPADGGAP